MDDWKDDGMMGARQLLVEDGWIGVRQLQIDNSALGWDNSAFSALKLDHSILKTCAHDLDNSRWGALELDHSRIEKMNDIHKS